MKRLQLSALSCLALLATSTTANADLIISEVVDGTLPGGTPKWVELTNTGTSSIDLSAYSFGNMNNGGTNLGGGAAAVLAGSLGAGESYVIGYDSDNDPFNAVYGFDADFLMGGTFINGDDVLILFLGAATGDGSDASIVDVYGVIGVDGTNQEWEYTDGYSYRLGTSSNNGVWDATDWFIAGFNSLEEGCGGDDACETINLQTLTTPGTHGGGGSSCGVAFCAGDQGTCPCGNGNGGDPGSGCANGSNAQGAALNSSGSCSIAAADLTLSASGLVAGQPGLYFQGNNAINGGAGNPFGDGLRCAGGAVIRLQVAFADSSGASATNIDIGAKGGVAAGDIKRYQIWYRDPNTSPCGGQFNLSNGIEVTWGA
ncbi:MAG: lamin tail domain-containing protein [Planctomycetes bacterium]|nr:lamin tail domain-containing protein [Planctomycetota bacterium]